MIYEWTAGEPVPQGGCYAVCSTATYSTDNIVVWAGPNMLQTMMYLGECCRHFANNAEVVLEGDVLTMQVL